MKKTARCIELIMILLVLNSCVSKKENLDTSIRLALESAPSTLDPRFTLDANGQRMAGLIFNSLVKVGPDLKIIGDAAQNWTYEKLTYRFQVSKKLSFSNGRPLSKEDLLFTLDQYLSEKCPFQSQFKSIASYSVEERPEFFELTLKLKEYNALLLSDLSLLRILPKSEVEQMGEQFSRAPIGTGSWRLREVKDNTYFFEARQDHPFLPPKSKALEVKIISDDTTRFLKVLKGEIDVAQSVLPNSKIAELEKVGFLEVHKYGGPSMSYMLINMKDPLLKNLYVRQILNWSIHRNDIIQFKLGGLATPATSLLHPQNPFFHEGLKPPVFDLERAKGLVESHHLKGKEITLKTSNTQEVVEVAKVLSHQIEQTGLKVNLQSYEWGTYFDDIKKGNFQVGLMRWVGVLDPDIYRLAFHSLEVPPGRNRGAYKNPLIDSLTERGIKIEDPVKRMNHYRKVQEIILEDLPIIPLWYMTQVAVVHKRIKGYQIYQSGELSGLANLTKVESVEP